MAGPSNVIVLEPDARARSQLVLGFAREGMAAVAPEIPEDLAKLAVAEAGVILVGGGAALVRRARALAGDGVTVVFVGSGVARGEAEAAGADEIVSRPAYLRDVVTIGRMFAGVKPGEREHLVGSLVETTGVYTLVRALATLGRSAVLTLIRGLRRGEIRFYGGEVTSAQVGLIHGQAALHQLLLWTDARFDYAHEDVVRRQQIPLSGDELFADAERFLQGIREEAGGLSPAVVLEQDVQRVHHLGAKIPTEVHGVLRMFDGHRVLADVLEDSPYRVFETLRVAQRALEAGLLRRVESQRPKATWRAVLAIEEWLVGNSREEVVARTAAIDSAPVDGGKRKKRKSDGAVGKKDIDWGALVPRVIGAEVGPLSGVVPAYGSHGEIEIASRQSQREGLEALMDTDKRERVFPTEIGVEPSIVVRGGDTDEWEKVEWEAKAKADAEAKAEANAPASPAAEPSSGEQHARVRESVERMRLERLAREEREATDAKAKEEAAQKSAAEEAREYATRVKAQAEAKRLEAERAAREQAIAKAESEQVAAAKIGRAKTPTRPPKVEVADAPPPIATEAPTSDGVVREAIAAADTAQLERGRKRAGSQTPAQEPAPAPAETAPPAPEPPAPAPPVPAPPVPVPAEAEPAVLVADLAAAHAAIAAALAKPTAPPPGDAASAAREHAVAEVRKDAIELTAAEEAFFKKADQPSAPVAAPKPESFDDLDEGYEPPKFWDRVFGRPQSTKPKK